MTKSFLLSSPSSSERSSSVNTITSTQIQPGTFYQTEIFVEKSACGVDLTGVQFKLQDDIVAEVTEDGSTSSLIHAVGAAASDSSGFAGVDIVVFPVPRWCAGHDDICDFTRIGLGNTSPDASDINIWSICDGDHIKMDDSYRGYHNSMPVPRSGPMDPHIQHGIVAPFTKSGRVQKVIIANCNTKNLAIEISGRFKFHCPRNSMSDESLFEPSDWAPVPYLAVSMIVFLICSVIFIRIEGPTTHSYVAAPQSEQS